MQFLLLVMASGLAALLFVVIVRSRPILFICLLGYSLVLSQSFPIAYVGTRPVNISTDHILVAGLLGAWLVARLRRPHRQYLPHFSLPYLLFSVWALFSLTASIFRNELAAHLPAFIEVSKWFMYTLVVLPCLEFVRSREQAQTVLKHLAVAGLIVVLVGYVQWSLLADRDSANIVSTFGSIAREDVVSTKNSFAVYVAMGWLILVAFFLERRINLWVGGLGMGMVAVLVLWSFSRSAVLGMLMGLAWLVVSRSPQHLRLLRLPRRASWMVVIVTILLVVTFVYSAMEGFHEQTPIGRITSLFADTDTSFGAQGVSARLHLLQEGVIALLSRPIAGYGFYTRQIELPSLAIVDNFYLDVVLDTGIVGLLFMLWLLAAALLAAWRARLVALRSDETTLAAWAWGMGGALFCLYVADVSASILYVGRILGTVAIALACMEQWRRFVVRDRLIAGHSEAHTQADKVCESSDGTILMKNTTASSQK